MPDTVATAIRDLVCTLLARGPVELFFDPAAPGCHGLPDDSDGHILVARLAGPDDARPIAHDSETLQVPYGRDDGSSVLAEIAWPAIFLLAGRGESAAREVKARVDAVPLSLGPDRRQGVRWLMAALGLGDVPADPNAWRFSVSPQVVADDADPAQFEADARVALQRLLATGAGTAVLLLDTTDSTIALPGGAPRGVLQRVLVPQLLTDLTLDSDGVAWSETHGGRSFAFRIPWQAIGAMRTPDGSLGWFWPLRLPVALRDSLAHSELWPHLAVREGVPLGQDDPLPAGSPPLYVLSPPHDMDKAGAVRSCLALGGALLLVDTRRPGIALPETLRGQALLAVTLGLQGLAPAAVIGDLQLEATTLDFDGGPARVHLPWNSVFLVAASEGPMRVHCWPDEYPEELVVALFALREMEKNHGQPPKVLAGLEVPGQAAPDGQGTSVGLGRNAAGEYLMYLRQPCGPMQDDGQTRLQLDVEFRLVAPRAH